MKAFSLILFALAALASASAQDYAASVLTDLKGVGMEVRPLRIESDTFPLPLESVEAYVVEAMERLEVRLLSSAELELMPGQPFLEVSIDLAHAQGPSHLYVVRLELREMAQLERPKDRIVSMAVPTWERKMLGVANRPEAIYEALDRLLGLFASEYRAANAPKD